MMKAGFNAGQKIKIGAVSYLNTLPLVYGLQKGMLQNEISLSFDYPGKIAEKLLEGSIDVGLVPVAIIPRLKEYHIVSGYGIAADGAVASVCIFSEVPMDEVKTVLLDYQSRTSVMLARYLLKYYWKKEVVFSDTNGDFQNQIHNTTAAVVIGDRALELREKSAFVYDLAEAWKNHTGLPFVFAAWVSNRPMPAGFEAAFDEANAYGLTRLEEVIQQHPYPHFDLHEYYTRYIHYALTGNMLKGMQLFLDYCRENLRP